jgi:DNA-binding transcriptional ArsR family regulator
VPRDAPNGSLALGELERRPPRLVVTPAPSIVVIAAEVAGAGRGVPEEWVLRARAQLDPRDLAALAPLGTPRGFGIPDLITLTADRHPSASVAEHLERIAALDPGALVEEIAITWNPGPLWGAVVARRPREWLLSYARALGRVWDGIRGRWSAAAAMIDREVERVETAVARRGLPEMMAGIHHRASVDAEHWYLHVGERMPLRFPAEGLTITPILGGPGCAMLTFPEEGTLSNILYPLPGATRMNGDAPAPAEALEALLGAQRAAILGLLDRPRHAGDIARRVQLTPGAVTHHLKALEASGLTLRERDARGVLVHRTNRGTRLLGLYEFQDR